MNRPPGDSVGWGGGKRTLTFGERDALEWRNRKGTKFVYQTLAPQGMGADEKLLDSHPVLDCGSRRRGVGWPPDRPAWMAKRD